MSRDTQDATGESVDVEGDFEKAVDAQEKAHAIITEWNLSYLSPFITGFLGHAYALAGRTEEGIAKLEQAVSEYETMGLGLFRSLITIDLGEALLLAGRPEDAVKATEDGLALARRRSELGHQAYGLRVLGEIASHPDISEPEAAKEHYETALALAEIHGMRPLIAHCHAGLGRLWRAHGKPKEAKKALAKASDGYQTLGMDAWLASLEPPKS